MATVLAPCQAILKTTALDIDQWLLCAAVALSIVAVTEIRKAFLRQTVGPVRLRRSPDSASKIQEAVDRFVDMRMTQAWEPGQETGRHTSRVAQNI